MSEDSRDSDSSSVHTELDPRDLLKRLRRLEEEKNRKRKRRHHNGRYRRSI